MLEVAALDAFYGDSHILQGVSFGVSAGARVAVLGRNGAGKTTLIKSLMNAGPRTAGAIRLDGRELGAAASFTRSRLGVSLVPEDRRIFPHLTVEENLAVAMKAVGAAGGAEAIARCFQRFPMLEPLRQRFGNQLSGGQQQMLAVARGLVAAPKLLLLDEPTEGLAPIIVDQMAEALNAYLDDHGAALLLSEQNLRFARKCARYVHVLDSGRFVFQGDWRDFDANPDIKTRYLAV